MKKKKAEGTRTQKALYNTISGLVQEIVSIICGLVLPRLILSHFGSSYNGVTNSIAQFISCIALLKSGIGGVTRASLYKPLVEHDTFAISETLNATQKYLRKIALIFSAFVVVLACIYPFFVADDFDWLFTFTLVIILSVSTIAQYYFGYTYQMLLEADQKTYIISIASIITLILNTIIAAGLIYFNCSIHIVKLGSAIVFALPPIFYSIYVKKKYSIDKKVKPNMAMIKQRWDAFSHQIANFINDNTDVMVITIFLGVKEVSVYTVYNMIAVALRKVITSFSNGMAAAFGNLYANNELEKMCARFRQYELLIFSISLIVAVVTNIMFLSFVGLYTNGITDVNYIRPYFSILISFCLFASCMKMPYQQVVYAVGMFKQTRNSTIIEAVINIVVSVICVIFIGIEGVIVGTICASVYRSISYSHFVSKHVLVNNKNDYFKKLIIGIVIFSVSIIMVNIISIDLIRNYWSWILYAFLTSLITAIVVVLTDLIIYRKDFYGLIAVVKSLLRKKKGV